jgi:hypothetical protein
MLKTATCLGILAFVGLATFTLEARADDRTSTDAADAMVVPADACAQVAGDWDATIDDGSVVTLSGATVPLSGTATLTISPDDTISHASVTGQATTLLGPVPFSRDITAADLAGIPALSCSGGAVNFQTSVTTDSGPVAVAFTANLQAGAPLRGQGTGTVTDSNGNTIASIQVTLTHR